MKQSVELETLESMLEEISYAITDIIAIDEEMTDLMEKRKKLMDEVEYDVLRLRAWINYNQERG